MPRRASLSKAAARPGGGVAQAGEELVDRAPAAVSVAGEELRETFLCEPACIGRTRVALEERQADRAVEVGEDFDSARPEPFQLGAELVAQRDALLDEDLAAAGQGAQRLGVVAVGHQRPEPVAVGACQLAEHERVEPIRLPARWAEPIAGRVDLVGMNRQHHQPGVQQPIDQQPVRTLDRDALHGERAHSAAQLAQSCLVMGDSGGPQPLPVSIGDQHLVGVLRPIHARNYTLGHRPSFSRSTRLIADRELPLRVLIDGPSTGLRPVAASGSPHRRERQVSRGPSQWQAPRAFSRRRPAARPNHKARDGKVDL